MLVEDQIANICLPHAYYKLINHEFLNISRNNISIEDSILLFITRNTNFLSTKLRKLTEILCDFSFWNFHLPYIHVICIMNHEAEV